MPTIVNNSKPKRRLRFSLLSLLVLVTCTGIGLAWTFNPAMRRAAAIQFLIQTNTRFDQPESKSSLHPQWQAKLFGAQNLVSVDSIEVKSTSIQDSPNYWKSLARHAHAIPELRKITIVKATVSDDQIDALCEFKRLEIVNFDQCSVTRVESLTRLSRPDVLIFWDCGLRLKDAKVLRSSFPKTLVVVSNLNQE